MDKKIITCPKCGHENLFPEEECANCGSSFALFPELRPLFVKEKQGADEVTDPAFETDDQQEKPFICPKCGHETDPLSVECSKCGVIFLKYYEIQARDATDEEKKAELLMKKKEEEKKTEALERQKEKKERAEALKRQKEEKAKAEALRKQKEEEAKAEALRKQKEEEAKAEALRKQKEEEEKAEALRKQKEEEEKAEALRKQKEEEEKAKALMKQKEEEAKAEALRKQKAEEAKAEALRKQKEEEEKAEALIKQKEEEEKRELQKKVEDITKQLKPKSKIREILKKYEGQDIGINYDSPTEIKGANLVKVGDDLFSIVIIGDRLMKSYPFGSIISVIEDMNGVSSGDKEEKSTFSIIIQVYHAGF
jgi:DNA-directed RNA polymerase subunit RPC12/RpoP